MIILRSTGPVISTRRSSRSLGIGATFHSPLTDLGRLREEIGQLAAVDLLLNDPPAGQQFLPARLELGCEFPQESAGLGGENSALDRRLALGVDVVGEESHDVHSQHHRHTRDASGTN